MKILFLTSRFPYPPHRGDKLKIFNLIKQLSSRGHEITLISFVASKEEAELRKALAEYCIDVQIVRLHPIHSFLNCALNIFSSLPFQVSYFKMKEMHRTIFKALKDGHFDIVHVHLVRMAQYGEALVGVPRVLDLTDAGSLYLERFLGMTNNPLMKLFLRTELKRLRRYEKILDRFEISLVCSRIDQEVLQHHAPTATINLLSNGIDLKYFSPNGGISALPGRIILTGNMSYYPNIDGALFFVREVLPKIKRLVNDAKLHIVGQNPSFALRKLNNDDVVVTGFVPDIKAEYLQSAVSIAPIRFGAGTLNKILEPMALGIPVVATSIASEGLPVENGRDILVADSPEDFANSVVRILREDSTRRMLSANAQSIVRKLYDWTNIAAQLEGMYLQAQSMSDKP
ncbi:MAG TPA: glycosyltransferase [Bacteroidota bacterium]|nr:glycosyltransferase [Bacteroidota bacterium]